MSGQQDYSGASMLELFRMEVESHSAALNDGLVALANSHAGPEVLQELMRAAHSIKGAARIVGLEHAVEVAHAMEDCFVAAQEAQLVLLPRHVDDLLRGTDFLIRSGHEENKPEETERQAAAITAALRTLKASAASESAASAAKIEAAGSAPLSPVSPTVPPVILDAPQDLSGMSLLDLFQSEVESNSALLLEGLAQLELNLANTEPLAELRRAAHSIKGAARIVGVEQATRVALALEETYSDILDGKCAMNLAKISALRAGTDLLCRIAIDTVRAGGDEQILSAKFAGEISEWSETLSLAASALALPAALQPAESEAPKKASGSGAAHNASSSSSSLTNTSASKSGTRPKAGGSGPRLPAIKGGDPGARAVRVNAASLSRLMGLAGESLVEAGWLSRFEQSLRSLQDPHLELSAVIERLQGQVRNGQAALPALLNDIQQKNNECQQLLAERMHAFEVFALRADNLSGRLYREVIAARMRPFGDGIKAFPRMVHDLAKSLGKKIRFEAVGKTTEVDRDILEKLEAPLNHLLRNAVDHGIENPQDRLAVGKDEQGKIVLDAQHKGGMLSVTVADDGRGVNLERVRKKILERKMAAPEIVARLTDAEILEFLFLPGFSTAEKVTEISGRGVGLDVVQTMVHEVSGQIRITTQPGKGCTFHVQLPITLSVLSALLVDICGEPYAFPLARIDRVIKVGKHELQVVENHQYIKLDGQNIGLVPAQQVLELDQAQSGSDELALIVISGRSERYGLAVDRVLGERELVVRPLDPRLGKVPNISATALMEDGTPLLIFDVEDMIHSIHTLLSGGRLRKIISSDTRQRKPQKRILVVDDSLTVREVERKLLENNGYGVDLATDGAEGWNKARSGDYDLVISDVDMPRMNGIELVGLIRADARLKNVPVVIVSYKDREEDRLRGMEAGANYYLTKSSFQDESLLEAVLDLIGAAD